MKHLKLALKNREISEKSWNDLYSSQIVKRIRKRYSVNEELAILRQRDAKPEEFDEYNAYAEACKDEVKKLLDATKGDA